jgi:esterase FrsA
LYKKLVAAGVAAGVMITALPQIALGQGAEVRSLEAVKAEVMRRAGKINPFDHIKPDDAKAILDTIKTLDRDEWAAAWCKKGLEYEAKGDGRAKDKAPSKELAELYSLAFNYCQIGRYPVATTAGKVEAYKNSMRQFRKAAKHFDVPWQLVEIPFKSTKLVGYLMIPKGVRRPPVVIHWGGVDGWKEDRQRQVAHLHRAGMATLTVDMPGTGENPTKYGDADAVKTYQAWIDHLVKRKDVDGSRIGVWGASFGGYWAARLAYEEPKRIKGAVFHGGNVHIGFQEKWLRPAFTTGGATYLFGAASLLEARGAAMGTKTLEEFLAAAQKMSLVHLGLINKPSAPILGVNGKLDDQAPVEDIYLLMEHGTPKEARVYSKGRHMGREPGQDEREIPDMITAWLKGKLAK